MALKLVWKASYDGPNDFPACFHAEDVRNKVFFNTSPKPKRTNLWPKYAAICKGGKNLSCKNTSKID